MKRYYLYSALALMNALVATAAFEQWYFWRDKAANSGSLYVGALCAIVAFIFAVEAAIRGSRIDG